MAETKKITKTNISKKVEEKKAETKTPAKKPTVKKPEVKKPTAKKPEVKSSASKTSEVKTPSKTDAKKTSSKKTAVKNTEVKTPKVENAISKIINPNDNENVFLFDDKDQAIEFQQIALIPYEKNLYCILKPVELVDEMAPDEAVVFLISEEQNDIFLDVVDNDEIVDAIFNIYYELFAEAKKTKQK